MTEGVLTRPRDRIVEAARDLFHKQGYRGVGVDAIAEAAGTNKMTLYRHFGSKDDLIVECLRTAIAEARKRTLTHYKLPAKESFSLEYVTDKPWSGYNWYKGNYTSVVQINTDTKIFIDRAIDVGSHESYPGHHVYNTLLEQKLYHDRGYVEVSLYPLFSPQSLIAEGSANYGIEVAFPGDEKVKFAKNVLLPLAGLDTTGIALYFKALASGKPELLLNERNTPLSVRKPTVARMLFTSLNG